MKNIFKVLTLYKFAYTADESINFLTSSLCSCFYISVSARIFLCIYMYSVQFIFLCLCAAVHFSAVFKYSQKKMSFRVFN